MIQAQSARLQVLFGGTFDPIHHGHLRMALDLAEQVEGSRVCLMPCQIPPHREQPGASADQRLEMLHLALDAEVSLGVEERELRRPGPSYTTDTLQAIRREVGPDQPLAVAMGSDSFATLASWHRWQTIPSLAHIIVIDRPGFSLPASGEIPRLLEQRGVDSPTSLLERPGGMIWRVSLTYLDISASDIRERILAGRSPRFLLPDTVWVYIQQKGLYGACPDQASAQIQPS